MPYVSLYRKYRSQTFDDVVGQDHVVKTIKNAIKAGRIAHGYLFCGSRGTGKTTVARLIAKALNCLSSPNPTPDPCNRCEACESITAGSAVDVIEMDAASNRGVDDVDALREGVKYPPMRLRYKVYIIDEAHQLSPQAKDAFLKTLEEPPPHAVFVLATTEAGRIPITIRSRCQEFDFRRGTVSEIRSRLKHVIECEGFSIEDDAVELIARLAAGSYRDGLSVLEQVTAYTDGTITAKDVYTVVGAVEEDVLLELGDVIASGDPSAAFELAERLLREGGDVRELLKSAANHFRDLLALKVGADRLHADDPRWRDQAEEYSQERLVHVIDTFCAAEKDLRFNEQHRLGLEMALLKSMARPAPAAHVQGQVTTPAAHAIASESQSAVPAAPAAEAQAVPVTPAAVYDPFSDEEQAPGAAAAPAVSAQEAGSDGPVLLADIQRDWQKVLSHLQRVMKRVSEAALAREGRPIDLKGSLLTLGFDSKHKFHRDRTQENADRIAQAIEQVMGVRLQVNTALIDQEAGDTSTVAASAPDPEPPQDPDKNKILTIFDGKEVDPGPDPWGEEQT